jgi:tetratricopeptide (TPR) repeat protein
MGPAVQGGGRARAKVLLAERGSAEGEAQLRKALALAPDSAETNRLLGCILAQQGRFDEAATQLERSLNLSPNQTSAWHDVVRLIPSWRWSTKSWSAIRSLWCGACLTICDLEWCEACLMPETNRREVKTVSGWQVRQPIYHSSVDRWRVYEPWLSELRQLLVPHVG